MLENLIDDRKKKLLKYKEVFGDPYPARVRRDFSLGSVLEDFEELEKNGGENMAVAGRIFALRDQGGIIFADLRDSSGKLQVVLKDGETERFGDLKPLVDPGDFLEANGKFFITKKGEKSILAKKARIVSKCVRPWPSSWFGLEDVEERHRKRYLDLLFHEESKKVLDMRFQIAAAFREVLQEDGFVEVETPVLQPIPGGALARPFKTHFNALDIDVYLRVAPELYLKRLLVGGFEKIFEIAKDFRNEGIDRDHNPEFSMIELYWAYQDYEGLTEAVEGWIKQVARMVGVERVTFRGKELKMFFKDWPRRDYADLMKEYAGRDLEKLNPGEIDEIFKKEVRPKLIEPVLVLNYPKSISPLTKARDGDPNLTERSQLVIAGTEFTNCFSELNDPIDQRERMEEQERRFRAGDPEASRMDEDFLEAVEYGMPPAAGVGIGIDRLAALFADVNSIGEVIAFTNLRPRTRD